MFLSPFGGEARRGGDAGRDEDASPGAASRALMGLSCPISTTGLSPEAGGEEHEKKIRSLRPT